ncbi:MAG: hypothetical protein CMK09_18795 [Ponticaulis sp.]|nr:hypothetical protein [Ponticaulis sp.]
MEAPPKLAERAEDAPPPEAPPQPRPVFQPVVSGPPSSGFGEGVGDAPPAPPPPLPPPPPRLNPDFTTISTKAYVSRVRYPRRAVLDQLEGLGMLAVTVERSGRVRGYNLRQSTGHRILDREILRVAEEVTQLDPLPVEYTLQSAVILIPFNFFIG